MSLQEGVRLGVVEPQIVHLPPDVASLAAAEEAIELADYYGLADGFPLDESQRFTLRAGLGERADGSWAASTVADFEPRQNGKNDTCAARELAGLILFKEELLIHTAHEFPTANESFLRLVAVFENWDELRRKVARIRYANGEQGIELLSGQRLKYRARTGGSGRGFAKADLVVYDEAQHLQAEHVAASGPARLSNPNNQSWYMGSGGLSGSANAWRMRRRALAGNAGRFAYVEHTAEQVALVDGRVSTVVPDVLDRDAWAKANPAYGRRITDESLFSLYEELGPELFARECLCIWDPDPGAEVETVVPMGDWLRCQDDQSAFHGQPVFAVDIAPDGARATIAAAGIREDGLPHVEVVENEAGTGWVVDRLIELKKWAPARRVGDKVTCGPLFTDAETRGVKIEPVSSAEHGVACAQILASVRDQQMRHRPDPRLDVALRGAAKRNVGDGWLWSRRSSQVDISPLVAITLALWAANQPAAEAKFTNLDDYIDE